MLVWPEPTKAATVTAEPGRAKIMGQNHPGAPAIAGLSRVSEVLDLLGRLPAAEGSEIVRLGEADGRVTAAPVFATLPMPPFDNSAVDGWAFRWADLQADAPTRLPIKGRIAAGVDASALMVAGGAARIFTGAMVPPDADTVVMQENASELDGFVLVPQGVRKGLNVRKTGENGRQNDAVIAAGRRLGAAHLGLAAAAGATELLVRPRLRVALLCTGNEVRPLGAALQTGTIPDQNGDMVATLLRAAGTHVSRLGIAGDDRGALRDMLSSACGFYDLVVTTGGVSVGDEDHLRSVMAEIGEVLFWRIAMKPGRPVALGMADRMPILALPGNPTAAFTAFKVVADPLIRRLSGQTAPPPPCPQVAAAFSRQKPQGLREFIPVRLSEHNGVVQADLAGRSGSSALASLTEADGFLEVPEDASGVSPGDLLSFRAFSTGSP